jgi:hypothetical protein
VGVVVTWRLILLTVLWCLLCLLPPLHSVHAGETCIRTGGLEVCVQAKGSCDVSELMPRETLTMAMELFVVSLSNHSDRRVRIDPANFVAITESGQAVKLDASLFQSIEIRSKLRKTDLGPGERVKGVLLFPSLVGHLRTIAHKGQPAFEIRLY